jgi:hypothetical protein
MSCNRGWRGVFCGFVLFGIGCCGLGVYCIESSGVYCVESDDIHGLRSLGRILHREFDPLPFIQVSVPFTADGRVMDKDVFLLPLGADKTIALDATKPLDSSYRATIVIHYYRSSLLIYFGSGSVTSLPSPYTHPRRRCRMPLTTGGKIPQF